MLNFRTLTRRWLPPSLKRSFQQLLLGYDSYAPSFSSAGEDMGLRHLLGSDQMTGFYGRTVNTHGYELGAQNVIILDQINEYFLIDRATS